MSSHSMTSCRARARLWFTRVPLRSTSCASWALLAMAMLLTFAQPTHAQKAAEGCKLVVMTIVGKNLPDADKEIPQLLSETLANDAARLSGCQVVSQSDVASMLDFEASRQVCGGDGESCLAEVGAALGADRIVSGTLGRLGNDWVLGARLLNVKEGRVEARAERVVHGAAEELRAATSGATRELFGLPPEPAAATTTASSEPARAGRAHTTNGPWFTTGVALGSVGAVALVGGGLFAGLAELQLGDPAQHGKQAIASGGQLATMVAVGGATALIAGGGVAGAAWLWE